MIDDWDFDTSEYDIEEFPYIDGVFYTYGIDMSKPLDERREEEIVVLETKFDAQKVSKIHNGVALNADYTIYWPLESNPESQGMWDKWMPIPVKRGMKFRGMANGVLIEGVVEIVVPSQLGRASCDVKVTTETEY